MPDVTVRTLEPFTSGRVLDAQASFGRPREDAMAFHGLVARSPAMAHLCRQVERLAPCARATLIAGEPGTGKSLLAAVAQRLGPCRHAPVVTARTGDDQPDLLRVLADAARGSRTPVTCLVPELADLSPTSQAALSAALAGSDGLAIGEGLHVIACTGTDPAAQIARGGLRPDLFYQVSAARYQMPVLADRADDLADLATALLRDTCRRLGLGSMTLASSAVGVLAGRAWPGHVRELRNVIGRAAALSDGAVIGAHTVREACGLDAAWPRVERLADAESVCLDAGERLRVTAALSAEGGNKSAAAQRLGMSRRSLYRLLERLDV